MKKKKRFEIRLTDTDFKIIEKKAEILGMTMTDYIRQIAVNKQVKGFKLTDLNLPEAQCRGQMSIADIIKEPTM